MGFQKLNKKGLQFKSAFYAVIVTSMVIIAIGAWIGAWESAYNVDIGDDLDDFDKLDEISGSTEDAQDQIRVKDSDPGGDFEGTTFRGVFGVINNIFAPFNVVFGDGGMVDALTERFGLPDYVRQGLVTMMIIAIVFAIIAVIFRLPRSSA